MEPQERKARLKMLMDSSKIGGAIGFLFIAIVAAYVLFAPRIFEVRTFLSLPTNESVLQILGPTARLATEENLAILSRAENKALPKVVSVALNANVMTISGRAETPEDAHAVVDVETKQIVEKLESARSHVTAIINRQIEIVTRDAQQYRDKDKRISQLMENLTLRLSSEPQASTALMMQLAELERTSSALTQAIARADESITDLTAKRAALEPTFMRFVIPTTAHARLVWPRPFFMLVAATLIGILIAVVVTLTVSAFARSFR
jgi:hypothetical protein